MEKLEEITVLHNIAIEFIEDCVEKNKDVGGALVLMDIVKDKMAKLFAQVEDPETSSG